MVWALNIYINSLEEKPLLSYEVRIKYAVIIVHDHSVFQCCHWMHATMLPYIPFLCEYCIELLSRSKHSTIILLATLDVHMVFILLQACHPLLSVSYIEIKSRVLSI